MLFTGKAFLYTLAYLALWIGTLCAVTLELTYVNGYGEMRSVRYRGWLDILNEWINWNE